MFSVSSLLVVMLLTGIWSLNDIFATSSANSIHDALHVTCTTPCLVLPLRHLGLGNRLRIMSGMHHVAVQSGRKLLVLWMSSEECNSGFHALFTETHESLVVIDVDSSVLTTNNMDRTIVEITSAAALEMGISMTILRPHDFFVDITTVISSKDTSLLLVWTLGVHAPIGVPCTDYLFAKSTFYRGLRPSPAVMARMYTEGYGDSTMGFQSIDRIVGIHIRAYDSTYDWAVVTPHVNLTTENMNTNTSTALRFDEASPLSAFVQVMEDILHTYPTTKFFIASNSVMAKENIKAHFGSNVVITIDAVTVATSVSLDDRSSEASMLLAAAEFFLLSACAYVVHSRGSSYAKEAAAIHMRSVVDISVENETKTLIRLLTQDASLPHCGLQDYIRIQTVKSHHSSNIPMATTCEGDSCNSHSSSERMTIPFQSSSTALTCYLEGGDRQMCTVSFLVCPCVGGYHEHFTGIPSLLCNMGDFNSIDTTTAAVTATATVMGDGQQLDHCVSLLAESNGYSLTK